MNKEFLIKNGNNGATYIFNISSIDSIISSLKFYKSFTLRQFITKFLLFVYLMVNKLVLKKKLKSLDETKDYLNSCIFNQIDSNLPKNCSVLISPTRDKIIVHNHDKKYFHKYAFGKSKDNVLNEVTIYNLLNKEAKYFNVSSLSELISDENYCEFKLFNKSFKTKSDDIVQTLVEFFNYSKTDNIKLEILINKNYIKYNNLKEISDFLIKNHSEETIPLGLVHKDFKPWNLDFKSGPLIYDFEESILDGLPAEDLLNYYIDPLITSSNKLKEVEDFVFSEKLTDDLTSYCKLLNLKIDSKVLIYLYLIDRTIFWEEKEKFDLSKKYNDLLINIFSKDKNK